jgi:hypothetical protein
MKRKLSLVVALLMLIAAIFVGSAATIGAGSGTADPVASGSQKFDDPVFCSNFLQKHGDNSLSIELNERCVLAIATTYIDGEQNSIPPEQILFAPDVSRHRLGTPPDFQPGNAAALVQGYHNGSSAVIASITDRHWVVEGPDAWINYTGFLKSCLTVPGFYVGERITVQNGLIHEILIAGVVVPPPPTVCPTS